MALWEILLGVGWIEDDIVAQGVWTQYTVVITTTTTQTQDRVDEVVTQKEGLVMFFPEDGCFWPGQIPLIYFRALVPLSFGRTPEGNKYDLSGPRLTDYTVCLA